MRHAFTLIELLVVCTIISVLASLTMLATKMVLASAHQVRCMSNLRQIGIGMGAYMADNQGMVPPPSNPTGWNAGFEWGWWQGRISHYLPGRTDASGNVWSAMDAFWCPRATWKYSQRYNDIRGNATSYGMNQAVNYAGVNLSYYRLARLRKVSDTILVGERWAHPNSAPGYGGVSNGILDAIWFRNVMNRDTGLVEPPPAEFSGATSGIFESSLRVAHRSKANFLQGDFHVESISPWKTCGPGYQGAGAWNMWKGM